MSNDQPKYYPVVWDEKHYIRFYFDTEEERQAFLKQPDLDKALEIANNLMLRESWRPISYLRVEEGEE
jgi:hypothetical protein